MAAPKNLYEKLTVYQVAMDHEQGFRSGFQSLLITIEGIFFGILFTLNQLGYEKQNWVLSFISIIVCVVLGMVGEYRARNVDVWRRIIVRLITGTELEKAFNEGNYRWHPFKQTFFQAIVQYLFGHWFERIVVLAIIVGWSILLYSSPCPILIQVLAGIAILFWFSYTFHLFAFRGGKMPDKIIY